MVMIINNKIKPPGGEPIWSWYSRAKHLDYLKGFLKPLAFEKEETAKAKDPEDIIVLSDTEDDINPENVTVEKPMPLVSVKQEPIDDKHEKLPVPEKNLPVSDNVNPESAVVYGPHQLEPPTSLFTKLNLFNIMDGHRRSTSLTNRQSIPLNIPQTTKPTQDKILSLPSPQTTQAEIPEHQNAENPLPIQSENSHTDETRSEPQSEPIPETTPTIPIDDSPLKFEFETGNPPKLPVAEQTDEEDNLPLYQVKKNQAKEKGKKEIQEEHVDKNPVAKIQVFPAPVTRRKTRSSTTQQEKETPSPTRKTKRKQPIAEQPVPMETTASKKRKKNTTQTQQPESQPDVSAVTPLEVITPQFLCDEYAARWDSTNKRKILSERYLDVEKFKSQCQLMPVFEKLNLVKSVTTQTSYPPIAIKEFYANLLKTIKEADSHVYGRVWLRGNEYNFDTRTINLYLGIDASDIEDPVIGANTITKVITGGTYSYWPAETNMLPAKSLTTKYAILHKLAMTNWMPNEHRGGLNFLMATLIYKIGKGIPVDLGDIIFKHVASFRKPESKESKVKLPFPCTIYGVLRSQGFKPEPNEPMEAPQVRTIDARLKQGSHVLDIFLEHASSSAPALNLDAPFTSKLTAQHLDKSIRDLNTIIQILVEKRTIEMQLREQLRLRDQEMTAAVTETPTDISTAHEADSIAPKADSTANSQEDESSESK
ncbi:uncharacterized protein LOC116024058 [Ipomoea triloba]|uniref:uncharacterized protein LOC116024058 n=1 Tax=Ipomoea triloba TaxID=35885 RepID=UPI00125D5ADA|nr:uncharacterized protein LOC116024058 [Ipomoea triloba]